jgi:hypothetical protein
LSNLSPFDSQGIRLFSTHSLDAYFANKGYLEQELLILFHEDEEEADPVFDALG